MSEQARHVRGLTGEASSERAVPMSEELKGRVVENHGMLVTVLVDKDECQRVYGVAESLRVRVRPPRTRVPPVMGDKVSLAFEGSPTFEQLKGAKVEGRVHVLEERTRTFERLGVPRQMLASYVDRLVIVSAVDPAPRAGLIDRMWVALDGQVPVTLVLNKADLEDGVLAAREELADFLALGVELLELSAHTSDGVDALRAQLSVGGLSLLVGHSGVGKSSLLNALVAEARLLVGDTNAHTGKGRHTTTVATCHELGHGLLVDTPGVRAFPLESLTDAELARRFPGLRELSAACYFEGCLHKSEPGCAVLDAMEAGTFPQARYERYRALLEAVAEERKDRPTSYRKARS